MSEDATPTSRRDRRNPLDDRYPPLDPEVAAALGASKVDFRSLFGDLSDATLPAVREVFGRAPAPDLDGTVERSDHPIPGTDGVVVRVHRPSDVADVLPGLFWMHGGGFVLDQHAGNDVRFERWCRHGVVGASIRYRLAPETRYPGPIEDCYAALTWLHDNAVELGIDPLRIGVGGLSAGGNLAAGLCLLARDRGTPAIPYQLLIYPALDDRQVTVSSRWPDPVWPPEANAYAWSAYLAGANGSDDVSPYAAPARATDLTDLPPALIVVGSLDVLADESIDYAVRLRHAGNSVDLYVYAGAPHGFDRIAPESSVAIRASRDIEEWLGRQLG